MFLKKDFGVIFELTSDNLFKLINDKYYFMVMFPTYRAAMESEFWRLGEIFLKKYVFTIDQDGKTIGFYNYNIKGEGEEEEKNNAPVLLIVCLVFGVLILVGVAFYFGTKFVKQRKKRANELKDDEYDYNTNDNKDGNDQLIEGQCKLGVENS